MRVVLEYWCNWNRYAPSSEDLTTTIDTVDEEIVNADGRHVHTPKSVLVRLGLSGRSHRTSPPGTRLAKIVFCLLNCYSICVSAGA